jgi:hypothetical protein
MITDEPVDDTLGERGRGSQSRYIAIENPCSPYEGPLSRFRKSKASGPWMGRWVTMLHVRSVAVSAAVISFFAFSIIGSFSGLSPAVCSTRALLGAAAAYIAAAAAVRIINAILIQAMIDDEMNKEQTGDARS